MTDTEQKTHRTPLTVIQGGKPPGNYFPTLPFADKMTLLREIPANRRLKLIIEDPDAKRLTRAFSPQEFYLMIKEIGEADAGPLLNLGSTDQLTFCLDLELWEKWDFSFEQAYRWLEQLLAGGEEEAMELLHRLDEELLLLIAMEEIQVGGGTGDLATDSERLGDWDHTFDSLYFITFRHSRHARLVGTLLDMIYRNDHPLYIDLMEGCRSAVKDEVAESCYQFRNGRLADLGFPSYEQALEIYAPLAPKAYTPGEAKLPLTSTEGRTVMLTPPVDGDTLLTRVLAEEMTDSLRLELGGLLNSALIAERGLGSGEDAVPFVTQRVYGWLNIALEYCAGSDEAKAAAIIRKEPLKQLFRLGSGIIQEIAGQARRVTSDDYATGKVLRGLAARLPRFYRGLDPDHIDGYREFRSMNDIRQAREFLAILAG